MLSHFLSVPLLSASLAFGAAIANPDAEGAVLEARQSTTWVDTCGLPAPGNFKAFNLGNCEAQLTFSRGKNVGVLWDFIAYYADGSQVTRRPFQNTDNIAVSDPFYANFYGINFIANSSESQAYTSIHEFTNVCRNGAAPTSWVFTATPNNQVCTPRGYKYTTGRITANSGTRPAKTTFSGRQVDSAGNVEISWSSVSGAQSYNPFILVPTGRYEDNSGYYVTGRGVRVSGSTTRTVLSGVARSKFAEEPRKVYVNVQNAQGVWSHTPSTQPINVSIR